MQDEGVVKPGYDFYQRPDNGPDYWQILPELRPRDDHPSRQAGLRRSRDGPFYQSSSMPVPPVSRARSSAHRLINRLPKWRPGGPGSGMAAPGICPLCRSGRSAELLEPPVLADPGGRLIRRRIRSLSPSSICSPNVTARELAFAARLIEIASEPRIDALHGLDQHIWRSPDGNEHPVLHNDRGRAKPRAGCCHSPTPCRRLKIRRQLN